MVQAFIVNQSTIVSGRDKYLCISQFDRSRKHQQRHFSICISTYHNVEVGFCDAELTSGVFRNYSWPETEVGLNQSLPCELGPMIPNGMARRTCNPDTAEWDPVSLDECYTCEYSKNYAVFR